MVYVFFCLYYLLIFRFYFCHRANSTIYWSVITLVCYSYDQEYWTIHIVLTNIQPFDLMCFADGRCSITYRHIMRIEHTHTLRAFTHRYNIIVGNKWRKEPNSGKKAKADNTEKIVCICVHSVILRISNVPDSREWIALNQFQIQRKGEWEWRWSTENLSENIIVEIYLQL